MLTKIAPIFAAVATALLQGTRFLEFWGVNPNLILVFLTLFAFFTENLFIYAASTVLGAIFLKTSPLFEVTPIAVFACAAFIWIWKKYSPWNTHLALAGGLVAANLIFYAIVDYSFIFNEPVFLMKEIFYNLAILIFVWLAANYFQYGPAR